jgi:hypothetical protein
MQEKLFPLDAKLNRVLGMLSLLSENKGKLRLAELAKLSKSHVDNLLPDVNAAKMLGLVKVSGECIILTGLGNRLHEDVAGVKTEIRSKLKEIEPFKSAYYLTKEKGFVVGEEVAIKVMNKGFCLYCDTRKGKADIDTALLQWGIMFGIISYNGKQRVWGKSGQTSAA